MAITLDQLADQGVLGHRITLGLRLGPLQTALDPTGPSVAEHAEESGFVGTDRTKGNQDSRAGSEALNVL